jgi:hypothetical protein
VTPVFLFYLIQWTIDRPRRGIGSDGGNETTPLHADSMRRKVMMVMLMVV